MAIKINNLAILRRTVLLAVALMTVVGLLVVTRAELLSRTREPPTKVPSQEKQASRRLQPDQITFPTPDRLRLTQTAKESLSVTIPTFATPGLAAALEGASADKSAGRQKITVNALNVGQEKIEALDVLLVDFTPQGSVSRVELRRLQLSVMPGAKHTTSFLCELPHDPADTQTLTISGVGTEASRQDADVRELIGGVVIQRLKGLAPAFGIRETAKGQSNFTPDVCYDSFRLSHELATRFGIVPHGNICNRYQHSFALAFAAAP